MKLEAMQMKTSEAKLRSQLESSQNAKVALESHASTLEDEHKQVMPANLGNDIFSWSYFV